MRILLALLLVIPAPGAAFAQDRDGRSFDEKPGIVLVKPQAWSPVNSAQVVRFSAHSDRRALGNKNQGYLELRLSDGKTVRQIEAGRVVHLIIQPEVPKDLQTVAERDRLFAERDRISEKARTVPGASGDIQKMVAPLDDAIARFDGGEVLVDGEWISAVEHKKKKAAQIEKSLRASLDAAKNKADFNLESNRHFLALKDFAKDDAGIQSRLDTIQAEYRAMVASEEQAEIIKRLSDSSISPSEADRLLQRLSASENPGESAKLVLKQADQARALSAKASQIRSTLDAELTAKPPELPPELTTQIQDLKSGMTAYRAGNPPQGLPAPLAESGALSAFSTSWPRALSLMQSKDFAGASRELALLESHASRIGPNARAAISELKTEATVEVDRFQKLSTEGQDLLASGQKEAALVKFEEALAVMPDKALRDKLAALKGN